MWVKDPSIAGSDLYTKGHILNINANKVYSSPPLGPLTLGPRPRLRLRAQSHAQAQCAVRSAQCAVRSAQAQAADRRIRAHRMLCQIDPSLVARGW